MSMTLPCRRSLLPVALVALLGIGGILPGIGIGGAPVLAQDAISVTVSPVSSPVPSAEAAPAPPLIELVDPQGRPFDLAQLLGRPVLLFFGYTHCPDVCPTTIGELFAVFDARPEVEAVFVTVDPERDDAAFLDEWTRYLPASFHAVTGGPGAIRHTADGYGVRYARVETSSASGYSMSHTADVYLIDPQGRLRATFPFGTPAQAMVEVIGRLPAS